MAFSLNTEAADGREILAAYWVPAQVNVGVAGKNGSLVFHAFTTKEAMDAGKAPIAGALKSYDFSEREFLEAQMIPMAALFPDGITGANIMYHVLARFAYYIARSRKDVPVLDAEGNPAVDTDGNPQMRSFFEEALDV
ncbi:MAG: hypothetical protein KY445_17185 [Armatimonadetes bacterium]|nr:hypothetical protein [Armatimonadota bacterium]